jgi:hypothetical protein
MVIITFGGLRLAEEHCMCLSGTLTGKWGILGGIDLGAPDPTAGIPRTHPNEGDFAYLGTS